MASNINYDSIDAEFPVAGVDNSTQGFRDNFNVIKGSLSAARSEILQLQATALLKSPIPVDGILDNNLANQELLNAKLFRSIEKKPETIVIPVSSTNPVDVYFTSGHYHTFAVNATTILDIKWSAFTGTDYVQKMRVELVHGGDSNVYGITIANTYIKKSANWPSPLELSENEIIVLDFWIYKESGANHPMNTSTNPVTYANYVGKFA